MSAPVRTARRGSGIAESLVACLTVLAATVVVTWPQSRQLSAAFAAHVDAYFSAWRLMWTAHALATAPTHLFDANIFHPEKATLAYSDATLLQGLIAAPFLGAGVSPILVCNVLLLIGFAGSGLAMYVLARRVTGEVVPALAAALVFTMAPYRIEHVMHLELQWTMWMPLTFWAMLRAVEDGSPRYGIASGLFVWLQFLSCIYYGVFLSIAAVLFGLLLAVRSPGATLRALPSLAAGGLLGAVLTLPYALPYVANAGALGGRGLDEILRYSAHPVSYLAAPGENRWWGWTAERWGRAELRLWPGLVALLLATVSLRPRVLRESWIYVVLALVTFELSLGLNGSGYRWLFEHVRGLDGLRAPARFGILVQCCVAVLAGLGTAAVCRRMAARGRIAPLVVGLAILALLAGEYLNRPLNLEPVKAPDAATADVYRMVRTLGPGVVIELPLPTLSTLPGHEARYAFWSAAHWNPLVNGYSGYYPGVYRETLNRMETFPDQASLERLQRLDVRYVIVHHGLYEDADRRRLLASMMREPSLEWLGTYLDPTGTATLFTLRR